MQHHYQVDKRAAYESLAIEAGVVLRGSFKSSKKKNVLRVSFNELRAHFK
jgi:hypothetical protein